MYKLILSNINGVEIWPLIAMLIFAAMFTGVLIWAVRMDKSTVAHMERLPLDADDIGEPTKSAN